ncbi:hypothetical protein [Clavibacter michiganensis]|uniref:hypothetical protein n=1 Tax=Clavibacter michiganensis TaxID=28447 RepID=UPI0026DBA994|nr:hypothetical protein [Clavibacter michiganensis]MDO4045000.1 hypothetical protein [Clavibacter michiganensis]MDO4053950.1 hypothetical protein [Clavibacter michiganensis]MDO4056438.1 hypothetical protein [Clavibacter michiganensis]MDO4069043.1 hypothetical protein [Clavibacter michiganensis]
MTHSENDEEPVAQLARRMDIVRRMLEHAADVWDIHEAGIYASHVSNQSSDFDRRYRDYFAATKLTLSKFAIGEEDVAWWTQVELYAGFADPIRSLRDGAEEASKLPWIPPRAYMLLSWARGQSPGPQYAMSYQGINNEDTSRHNIIPPGTETPDDFVWAPILLQDY